MSDQTKPILLLDFDGVVCRDELPVEGFFEWAIEAHKHFNLMVYSRSNKPEKIEEMELWLQTHIISWRHQQMERNSSIATAAVEFTFPTEKPEAFLTIEDRSIAFNGKWRDEKHRPDALLHFVPWHSPDFVPDPADEDRPSNVVPPPNARNICPRHPWMTLQEANGRRRCTATGCTWTG